MCIHPVKIILETMNKSYIYRIAQKSTGKVYIGSSIHPERRRKEHFRRLNKNKHHSPKLQRAYNKYGINDFVFDVIDDCNQDIVHNIESEYITKYDSYNNGFNCTMDAYIPPIGERNGMHKIHGRIHPNKDKIMKTRGIILYNIETGNLTEHHSLIDLEKLGFSSGACCDALNNKKGHVSAYGYFLFWKDQLTLENLKTKYYLLEIIKTNRNGFLGKKRPKETGEKISKKRMGMKFTAEHCKNMSLVRIGKRVKKIIRNDGKIYNSIKDAAENLKCDRTSISHILRGKHKTVYGYSFKYYSEPANNIPNQAELTKIENNMQDSSVLN